MKKLLVLIAASMTSSLFLYTLVSMDQPARHPALGATELPPLIAVHDFYGAPEGEQDNGTATPDLEITWQSRTCLERENTGRLTLPQTKSNPGPLPAVILVNDGGAVNTWPDSAREGRFLANRGYVVLSIDCPSLAEPDPAVAEQAAQRSDRCTENTIADGARRLVDQGIADPAALAVIGSGFGGYAALRTMSAEPGLFKAALVHSPVIDPSVTGNVQEVAAQTCSTQLDIDQATETYAAGSPSDLLNSIQGAVLLTHGEAGTGAGTEQTELYSRDLLYAGKDIEVIYFSAEEPGDYRWQTRVQIARLTESFLARHLGGRNGGYDYIEFLAKLF